MGARNPILGSRQPFPMHCMECDDVFSVGDVVTMLPVICEGDVLCVGELPFLSGDYYFENYGGRVLWATWLCAGCASLRRGVISEEIEPIAVRRARLNAEREYDRSALARGRQVAVERARAQRYR